MMSEDYNLEYLLSEINSNSHAVRIESLGDVSLICIQFKECSKFYEVVIKRVGYICEITMNYRANNIFRWELMSSDYSVILAAVIAAISIKVGENE